MLLHARTTMPNVSRSLATLAVIAATLAGQGNADPTPSTTEWLQNRMAELAEATYPRIVTVTGFVRDDTAATAPNEESRAEWVRRFGSNDYPGFRRVGVASGIVVSEAGHVLTSYRTLLQDDGTLADLIDVETDDQRRTISAFVGAKPEWNLALVKLAVFKAEFPPQFDVAPLGDSDAVGLGSWAIGAGNPFGPERFFALGNVARLPDPRVSEGALPDIALQVTMRVHPEAYGGPLIDLKGDVIGLLCPRKPNDGRLVMQGHHGIEFAVPSRLLAQAYAELRDCAPRLPWLGGRTTGRAELIQRLGPEAFGAMTKPRFGVLIETVDEGSPLAVSGIRSGDFLVKLDGQIVYTPSDYERFLHIAGIGHEVALEVFRDGETTVHPVVVGTRPANVENDKD